MLFKIEDASYEGNEAVERSKGNVSKAEDTIEAAQKEINVSFSLELVGSSIPSGCAAVNRMCARFSQTILHFFKHLFFF